jgi:hypothetical protein
MLRFLLRFLGLVGLVLAGAGALGLAAEPGRISLERLKSALQGQGDPIEIGAVYMLVGGAAIGLLVIALESAGSMWQAAGRRSALGMNVLVQIALAVAILAGINFWSFDYYRQGHYERWDCTRDRAFTLPENVAAELKKLSGETTVIVNYQHQDHNRFSKKKADRYDSAAEHKIVEKIEDLVDQLREFGPQFRVVVLDVEDENYDQKFEAETAAFPGLKEAIADAPESSVFFCAGKNIQRLDFHEFYQLDKTASKAADNGRGNLVLLPQGVEPFVRRVLAIEEKRPRIGVAVIHEWLSTHGSANEFSLAGLKKSLTNNGFEVEDILLKRWGEGEPEPAAYTYAESRLEMLEEEQAELNEVIPAGKAQRESYEKAVKLFKESTLEQLSRTFSDQLRGRALTEPDRKLNLDRYETLITAITSELEQMEEERRKNEVELAKLSRQETVVEGKRMSNVKEKTSRLLAECDLLIIPRMTLMDLMTGQRIPSRVHRLNDAQVSAIRTFVRSGKPVFVMFGPTNEPSERMPIDAAEGDALEQLMGELGIVFGNQTILFTAESRAFAARRVNPLGGGQAVEIPPLDLDSPAAQGFADAAAVPNPLRNSLQLIGRSVGQKLDIKLRYPRPVYFTSIRAKPAYQGVFLFTDPASWNEEKPFPERAYTPRFEPAKPDDPKKGTPNEERRGPFPVGVALQTTVPPELIDSKYRALKASALVLAGQPMNGLIPVSLVAESLIPSDLYTKSDPAYRPIPVRVAAIGHGGVFVSADASQPDLSPAREQLLLQTVNWLLAREDRLPHAEKVWQYPRAELSERDQFLWRWGAFLQLPFLFACMGFAVLLLRRTR